MTEHSSLRSLVLVGIGAGFGVSVLIGWTACSAGGGKAANPPVAANANAPAADRYKVTADTTPFYRYGPQEANGPDETLKKDAELTMIKRSSGYSEVTAPDGQTGYVGTDDIGQLSAQEVAAENAAQQQAAQAAAQKRLGLSGGTYTIPPEAGNDERLPVADTAPTPKPTPTPTFRY
jgi:hypothetical protein